jgi:hypothetical protein
MTRNSLAHWLLFVSGMKNSTSVRTQALWALCSYRMYRIILFHNLEYSCQTGSLLSIAFQQYDAYEVISVV